jgi:hypothetical protein
MKNTKRIISLVLACLILALSMLCFASCGETEKGPFVYVTVADENGEIVARYKKIEFTEGMTVDGALAALHAEKCEGGYASAESAYGLSLTKLWGVEGGAYGYYVNNASPSSLADTLKEGDHVYAFVYTDTEAFSDTYAFFTAPTAEATAGEALALTLSGLGYDEAWNTVTLPVEGAKISVDGTETNVVTDADGKATLTFDKKGTYVVTAAHENKNLVTPFVIVTVK